MQFLLKKNGRMHMTAKEIWTAWKDGQLTLEQAKNCLLETMFLHRREYGLGGLDDDEFSEFILYIQNRIPVLIEKYDPSIGEFSTYLFGTFTLSLSWLKRRNRIKYQKDSLAMDITVEESYAHPGETQPEEEAIDRRMAEYSIRRRPLNLATAAPDPRQEESMELNRLTFLVLALKSCHGITDDLVEKVALISGMEKPRLQELLDEARKSMVLKERKIHELENRRNYAYYHHKKLQAYSPDSLEECSKFRERWARAIEELSVCRDRLVPTNKTVGKLLGISPRKVAYLLRRAHGNVDSTDLSCYALLI